MLFSEFADILYKHSGSSYKPYEYLLLLFDTVMQDPTTPQDIQNFNDNKYNPFGTLAPDTLDRLFKGTNPLSPRKVHIARNYADTNKFAHFINSLSWESQRAIDEEFKKRILDFNVNDTLGYACADLFLQIMDDIYDKRETSSPILLNSGVSKQKIKAIPATTVYFDNSDGKLHIGDIEISIPTELTPPNNIAPDEELYVKKLLDAYANAMKKGVLSKDNLELLPQKYKRNFSDQRINYYSAVRIERFVRETIADGDIQATKWKSDTLDYIKDTLWDDYDDGYKRLTSVMKKVVDSSTTSIVDTFQHLVGPKEKKGVCHLLANVGDDIYWVDENE